jgi:hypothetical protein
LESQRVGESERTQQALAAANAESLQLKETVHALRDQMDAQARQALDAAGARESQHERELAQLRETIQQLRLTLESAHVRPA